MLSVERSESPAGVLEPRTIWFGSRRVEVRAVVDRWHGVDREWWKVETDEGCYVLRLDEAGAGWELAAVVGRQAPASGLRIPVMHWRTRMPSRNTICLWYDGTALQAAQFYAATFPDSAVGAILRAPGDYPAGKQGDVLTVGFTVIGIPCLGLNGGPAFRHTEAFSFQVATDDQAETDRLWNAIVGNGGQASECGWCKDRWGLSWQITPRALTEAIADPDPAAARRAFEAMMQMGKIDIAAIEAARRG